MNPPWYRQLWPWLIISGPAAVLVAGAAALGQGNYDAIAGIDPLVGLHASVDDRGPREREDDSEEDPDVAAPVDPRRFHHFGGQAGNHCLPEEKYAKRRSGGRQTGSPARKPGRCSHSICPCSTSWHSGKLHRLPQMPVGGRFSSRTRGFTSLLRHISMCTCRTGNTVLGFRCGNSLTRFSRKAAQPELSGHIVQAGRLRVQTVAPRSIIACA